MDMQSHWSQVYASKTENQVSWYQQHPEKSLRLIQSTAHDSCAAIIDVGAGASVLVDHLLNLGYSDLTLLDIATEALDTVRHRLGHAAAAITWQVGDITTIPLEPNRYDIWHDRAVFHFLTDPAQRRRYVEQVIHALKPDGIVIMAAFALDGPEQCSGLKTARYSAASLHSEFGGAFELLVCEPEIHITPWGSEQRFVYCCCRKRASKFLGSP